MVGVDRIAGVLTRSDLFRRRTVLAPLLALAVLLTGSATASALDWTWTKSRVVESAGSSCGSTVIETVDARVGAFALEALTPVGTPVYDAYGYGIVARVTSIVPVADSGAGVPGLAFTLTGSDSVCDEPDAYVNGWETEPLRLRIRYTRHERVYFREFASSGNRYARRRPQWIHGGSDFGWTDIHWSSWGARTAEGHGSYYYVDKGRDHYRTIRFPQDYVLSNPQPCHGQLRYLRWERVRTTRRPTWPPVSHRQVADLTCDGGIYGDI
jgi:hypothetical protein